MFKTLIAGGLIALTSATLAAPAFAEGDAKAGKKVFRKCKACHQLQADKNGTGPNLVNIIGRASGSVEAYGYSDAMAAANLVWDAETLAAFLAAPKEVVPGNSMSFSGLKKEKDITNLIAYLAEN